MIIVDASVLTNALTDDGPVGMRARTELSNDAHWAAPEHLLVEAFSAIRGRWLGHKISSRRAQEALAALTAATLDLLDTTALLPRMWQLRANVTGYDAAYIAAAEAYKCTLVTADQRLASAPGIGCTVVMTVK
jgi:predicted nucleic acid-binding protein